MLRRELITAISLMIISIIIIVLIPFQVETVGTMRPGNFIVVTPKTFPIFLAGLLFLLSTVNLILVGMNWNKYKQSNDFERIDFRSVMPVFIVLLIYALILEKAGYVISTVLLMVFMLKYFRAPLWQVIGIGFLLPPFLFYVFRYLYVSLPKGFLG